MRRIATVWVCAMLMASGILLTVGQTGTGETNHIPERPLAPVPSPTGNYLPHAPIRIDSNAGFAAVASSGDGSVANPWIIEGWNISGTGVGYCIYVGNTTDYFTVRNNSLHDADSGGYWPYFPDRGLVLVNVQNGIIFNNSIFSNWGGGVYSSSCNNNMISNNNVYSNWGTGILSLFCNGNILSDNNVSSNWAEGIVLTVSNNNSILDNRFYSNDYRGIHIESSTSITCTNNLFVENGIHIQGFSLDYWNTHNIDATNTINGKPVYYLKNQTSGTVPLGAGEVILANCTNVIVENQNISNGTTGIELGFSNNNTIINNTVSENDPYGIYLQSSNNNAIANNTATANGDGIYLYYSINNSVDNNTASNNGNGIAISSANSNIISNNSISDNYRGISIYYSMGNMLYTNTMLNCGIGIWGDQLQFWNTHNIATSNSVNGKPVHYWKNQTGGVVPIGAGQVILANCTGVFVENQNISNGGCGILLGFCADNTISSNTVSFNRDIGISIFDSDGNTFSNNTVFSNTGAGFAIYEYSNNNSLVQNIISSNLGSGVFLQWMCTNNTIANNTIMSNQGVGIQIFLDCSNNTVLNNTISSNIWYGVYIIISCNYNKIYHNTFDNPTQAYDDTGTNFWDDGYPSGGNFWSDYSGIDLNSTPAQNVPPPDGIGDTPYTNIGGGMGAKDNYPLMVPKTVPTAKATGPASAGTNNVLPTITYSAANAPAFVDIYYSPDGGTTWIYWGQDADADGIWPATAPLPVSGTYYWLAATNSSGDPAPVGGEAAETGPYVLDITAPTIASTTIPDGATGVGTAAGIYGIWFSEMMDVSTDPIGNITTNLPGVTWAWDSTNTVLNGTYNGLNPSTAYYVNLTAGGFRDVVGNTLTGDVEKNFTAFNLATSWATATGAISSGTSNVTPTITYDFGNAPVNVTLWYNYSGGGPWINWGVDTTVDGTWTPSSALGASGTYYWCAQADAEAAPTTFADRESGPYLLDITAPMIAFATPADDATNVSTAASTYVMQFSETMNTNSTPLSTLPGVTWNWDATRMWLNGTYGALSTGTTYYVNLTGRGFKDVVGNALSGDMDKNFTTQPAPPTDTAPPTSAADYIVPYWRTVSPITITATANDANGTVANVTLWFSFSIDNATWGVWTAFGTDPSSPWQWSFGFPDGEGYYRFYTRANDTGGNYESASGTPDALCAYDSTPPSGNMSALPPIQTIGSFNVTANASDANGIASVTLYYRRNSGQWVRESTLSSAPYTWAFDTATRGGDGAYDFYVSIVDIAGLSIDSAPVSTLVDTTPPTCSGAPTGLNASVGTSITITFSEPMDNACVEAAFGISPAVQGAFRWNAQLTVLTFVPTANLTHGTIYTITIGTGAKDAHGLALATAYGWSFTTAAPVQLFGSVEGIVTDENGNPIPGATVSIGGRTTTTNETGWFVLHDVPIGTHDLVVSRAGYMTKTIPVDVVANQTKRQDVPMAAAREPAFDWWWIALLLVMAIVVAVVVVALIARRRKPKAPEEAVPLPPPQTPSGPEEQQGTAPQKDLYKDLKRIEEGR